MKPFQKVLAIVLAAIMMLAVAGCGTNTLTKEWSYKYNDELINEKFDIGVYIYALSQAYSEAEGYAADAKGYEEGKPFTSLEIEDEDGNKAVASDWIKNRAEELAVELIAVDQLFAKHEATMDEAEVTSSRSSYRDLWDKGYQNYYAPFSDSYEPFGVSFDSYFEYILSSLEKQSLFHKIYGKDGVEEVSDKELTKHFTEEYVAYSYVPVNLYETVQSGEDSSTSKPFGKKKMNGIIDDLKAVAEDVTNGDSTAKKAIANAKKEYKVADDAVVNEKVELFETTETNNADIAKALKKIKAGEATTVTVGKDGDSPVAYLIVKHDIKDYVKDYVESDENRPSVLESCKMDDFNKMVEDKTAEILKSDALVKNSKQIKKYDPSMFYKESTSSDDIEVA